MSGTSGFKGSGITDPFLTPDAPTITGVSGDIGSADVTFTAPADTGGAAIDSYVITAKQSDGTSVSATASAAGTTTVAMTAGGTTTFAAQALNKYGAGQFSGFSNSTNISGGLELYAAGGPLDSVRRGVLGLNDNIQYSSPVQVGALGNWRDVDLLSSTTVARKTDGTLWAWGIGTGGFTGQNDVVSRSSPVQVGALTNWADIANASGTWLAVKTDGTLWACGSNSSGSAGQNNLIGYSSPVQIGSDTDWSKVFGGGNNWWAIKTDGTLYACGYNLSGRLGDNTIINRSSPVQIGSGTWSLVSGMGQVFAVSTAGELWVWGNEPKGEAGLNTRDRDRSSPVQVGALTNWNGDIAAVSEASYAVKEDGTLWSWGSAQNGRLGNNSTTVSRSSPVQVGALATWSKVTGGGTGTAAVKTDGTLWGWGENSGQYRINNLTFASSPVQTGSDTDWFDVTMPRNSANDRTILITKLA